MDLKRILLITIMALTVILSVSAVSAGLFDGLMGGDNNSDNAKSDKIPMETQDIDGLFKISATVGCKFVYDYPTKYGPTYKNKGKYDVTVSDIIFIPYEFDSLFPGQNVLYEEDGDITVYEDIGMKDMYYVDRHVDGCTVSLMGWRDLDLLKEMESSVEITNK